jgi:hypothetical protein
MENKENEIRVRRILNENWIWKMIEKGFDGKKKVSKKVKEKIK